MGFCLSTLVLPFQYYSADSLEVSSSNVARTRRQRLSPGNFQKG